MNRKFALAGLLRVRVIAEDTAAGALAAARRDQQRAQDRATATAVALGGSAPLPHADPACWQASVAARLSLSALLVEDQAELAVAEQVTAEKAAEWSAARRATRSVERLAERHAEEVRVADERAEQQVLDEVGARSTPEVVS